MNRKKKQSFPLPVRFNLPLRQRIQLAAKRFGLTTSGIIRFAVIQQLTAIESGVIHLTNQPDPAGVCGQFDKTKGFKPTEEGGR